jgi:cell wall-associated NlpC family hydrolase
MKKIYLLSTLGILCYFIISCSSSSKIESKPVNIQGIKSNEENFIFVNPTTVPIDWKRLQSKNRSKALKKFIKYSQEVKIELNKGSIPYAWKGISKDWNQNYFKAKNKYDYMRSNGIDCTRFLWYLYSQKIKLPYNSKIKNAPITSETFAKNNLNSQLKNFIRLTKTKKGFKPRTGDILAFPGHALAVLDPKKCIAIQSSVWLCTKIDQYGSCHDSVSGKNAGVSIYKLMNKGDCENGYWKQLDTPKNTFTSGWRPKAF